MDLGFLRGRRWLRLTASESRVAESRFLNLTCNKRVEHSKHPTSRYAEEATLKARGDAVSICECHLKAPDAR
eukprot:2541253-Pleurochrysis_carterae.AAC.2